MVAITKDEVKGLAHLARISFSDAELENFASQITKIRDMISTICEVDTDGIEPLASVCDSVLRMREDVVTSTDIREDLFSNAPGKDANIAKQVHCFVVPTVL